MGNVNDKLAYIDGTKAAIKTAIEKHGITVGSSTFRQYANKIDEINPQAYGVQWDVTNSNPAVTRIGNMPLHATLPVHNKIKACLLLDNGTVNYYLNQTDWSKKEDGTASNLTGTDGQVMVEIPAFYWKFTTDGNIRRVLISEYPLTGYTAVPRMFVSAYEAVLQRSNLKLASVKNLTTDFRGGSNTSAWDAAYNTMLGRPVTSLSRTQFRTYARNRSTGWQAYTYQAHTVLWWLFVTEFATRQSQAAINAALTAEGYKQGALGAGCTTIDSNTWNHITSYGPFIPTGASDSLASGTGEVNYTMPLEYNAIPAAFVNVYTAATAYTVGQYTSYNNALYKCILNSTGNVPTNTTYFTAVSLFKGEYNAATAYQPDDFVSSGAALYRCILASTGNAVTNTTYFSVLTRTTIAINRYRGVEMPFGHIFKYTDGINVKIQANDAGGESQVWVSDNPATWNDSNYTGYENRGLLGRTAGYFSNIIFGAKGDWLPSSVAGGSSTLFYCDYNDTSIPASGESLIALLVGGNALYGALAGFVYASTHNAPSLASAAFGSRLCFLP